MTQEFCEFEARVALAARTDSWPDGLRQHVRGCPACGEALRAAAFLGRVASEIERAAALPEPTRIWLKARLEQAIEAEIRASGAPLWSRGLAGFAAALSAWLVWRAGADTVSLLARQLSGAVDALTLTAAGIAIVGAISYLAAWRPRRRSRF